MGRIYYGSDVKLVLAISFEEAGAEPFDFEVSFYLGNSQLTLKKEDLIKEGDKYLACIKAPATSKGRIKGFVTAHFNDSDFADGVQTVVKPIEIDETII